MLPISNVPRSQRFCIPTPTAPHSAPKWKGNRPNKPKLYSPRCVCLTVCAPGSPLWGKIAPASRCPVSLATAVLGGWEKPPLLLPSWLGPRKACPPTHPYTADPLPLASPPGGSWTSSWSGSGPGSWSRGAEWPSQAWKGGRAELQENSSDQDGWAASPCLGCAQQGF